MSKIKAFFKKDIFLRLLALFIAIIIWFLVVVKVNPNIVVTFNHIPVSFEGIYLLNERDLMIVDGDQSYVTVKIEGPVSAVASLTEEKIYASVSTSRMAVINTSGTYNLRYEVSVDMENANVISRSPYSVELKVEKKIKKSVPVEITFLNDVPEGYSIGNYDITPNAINIIGAQSIVDNVEKAIVSYDVGGLTSSRQSNLIYTFVGKDGKEVKPDGITADFTSVTLDFGIVKHASIPLTVTILPYGIISQNDVSYALSTSALDVYGDPAIISGLNSIELGSINIGTVTQWQLSEVILPLMLPNGVMCDNCPSSVTVKVDFPDYETRDIIIPASMFAKTPGFKYADASLTVTVLGKESDLADLSTGNFTVTPVISGETSGGSVLKAAVGITVDNPSVMVLGKYYLDLIPIS